MVLGLCRSLLRNQHDGEDAAQQTFLSAYASLLAGTEPRDPGAWLATIARNECRSRAQRRMREPLAEAEPVVGGVDPLEHTVQASEVDALRLALARLPQQQRRAFVLREFSGLSYEELALALGVSQPAIESLLFRARRQLRGSLRAAAAAAAAVPVSLRDWFSQLASGSDPGGAAGIAKLGSVPLAVKVGSLWAGTAILSATAVAVAPMHGHHERQRVARGAQPRARAVVVASSVARTSPPAHAIAAAPPIGVADTTESRHSGSDEGRSRDERSQLDEVHRHGSDGAGDGSGDSVTGGDSSHSDSGDSGD